MTYIDVLYDILDEQTFYEELKEIFVKWQGNKNIKIDIQTIRILQYYIYHNEHQNGSIYLVHKFMMKYLKMDIDYKTIGRRIKKLFRAGILILDNHQDKKKNKTKKSKEKKRNPHNAIYYKLSSFGIFYIFVNKVIISNPKVGYKTLICNHDFFLFKCIIYRIFPLELLNELKSDLIWDSIITYIENYFIIVERIFELINRQNFLLRSVKSIEGLINIYAFNPQPMLEDVTMENINFIRMLCNELGGPHYSIIENKITDIKNKKQLIEISTRKDNKIIYVIESKNTENSEEKKVRVFKNSDNKKNVLFEFNIQTLHFKQPVSVYDREEKCYYISLKLDELLKEGFEKSGQMMKFYDNTIKLILDISNISSQIDLMQKIGDIFLGEKDISEDVKKLRTNTNYMNFFHETKEFVNDSLLNFEKYTSKLD